jgi:hypothetical protein
MSFYRTKNFRAPLLLNRDVLAAAVERRMTRGADAMMPGPAGKETPIAAKRDYAG